MSLPRGLRNNNPGNIIKGKSQFLGEKESTDSRFRAFISMEWGYRAMYRLLLNYLKMGFNTIDKIINRWAPPIENKTSVYIQVVEKRTGINRNKVIQANDMDSLVKIVNAISWMENGIEPTKEQVLAGWNLLVTGASVKKK